MGCRQQDGVLYGGGFHPPGFSSTRLCYLDRGVIFAIAHVRGGADMGREWYDDGKLLKVDMGQGHPGSTGRYDRLKEAAFDYAWILSRYGINR